MTVPLLPNRTVQALVQFGLNTADTQRLAQFYERAFGASVRHSRTRDGRPWVERLGGAERTLLTLGDATFELLEFYRPGRPYPRNLPPADPRFQHFAIVVTDMRIAMERLSHAPGWNAISSAGPQTLPQSSGGVTAFKFRDPDGHPLEFLQFPTGQMPAHWRAIDHHRVFLGFDHSALSVTDIDRSLNFYLGLGLQFAARTFNHGIEQASLDGVSDPELDVIQLKPMQATPHVELLHYRTPTPSHEDLLSNDIAATRLVFCASEPGDHIAPRLLQDPDGHFFQVLGRTER